MNKNGTLKSQTKTRLLIREQKRDCEFENKGKTEFENKRETLNFI